MSPDQVKALLDSLWKYVLGAVVTAVVAWLTANYTKIDLGPTVTPVLVALMPVAIGFLTDFAHKYFPDNTGKT
jgi:hypothetical protein